MRHSKAKNQLNRFTSWRKATVTSLAKNVLIRQSIRTTKAKALAAKPLIEKLITLAKQNTLSAKRRAYSILGDHRLVAYLFKEIATRFNTRSGGYTRMLNLGVRRGDNADMVVLELAEVKKKIKRPKKEKEAKPGEEPAAAAEEKPVTETKPKPEAAAEQREKEKPPIAKKPLKKFLGGVRGIFKKERDSL